MNNIAGALYRVIKIKNERNVETNRSNKISFFVYTMSCTCHSESLWQPMQIVDVRNRPPIIIYSWQVFRLYVETTGRDITR